MSTTTTATTATTTTTAAPAQGELLALELKGGLYTLTALRIYTADSTLFAKNLEDKIKQAPKFFYCAPVILDLSQFKMPLPNTIEHFLNGLLSCIRSFKLIPVGIVPMQNATEAFIQATRQLDLAIISESRGSLSTTTPAVSKKAPPIAHDPEPLLAPPTCTRIMSQPVRSGQQIYAPHGDLLILSSVSHGAELLADGHIHVYGPLRGRALAGISGNQHAHIFCQSLEAELVSIAGRYKISEDLKDHPLWKKPTRLFLEKGKLQIAPL